MDVWAITVAALRRWYVLIPLLALTALAALSVGRGMEPEYEVAGAAMLVPGTGFMEEGEAVVPNPYGSMDDANDVIGIVLNGPGTRSEIAARGLEADYELDPASRSTIMQMSVRAATPEAGVATGEAVFELAAAELEQRQSAAGVPPNARYQLQVLQAPYVVAAVTDGKLRNMAVTGVLGGALSLLVTVLFDDLVGLLRRWRRGRSEKAEPQETGTTPEAAPAPGAAAGSRAPGTAAQAERPAKRGRPGKAHARPGSSRPAGHQDRTAGKAAARKPVATDAS